MMKLPTNYDKLSYRARRRAREQYIQEQDGKCFWCGEDLGETPPERITNLPINWRNFPEGFLKAPVHLQHDHRTGMTEGAVHGYCNAVMWQYHGR